MSRIGLFSAYYEPHLGGVEKYTKGLAEALVRQGNEVTIVTSSLKERSCINNEALEVVEIPSLSLLNNRFPMILPGKSFRSIERMLLDFGFDVVVINTRYYPISLLGAFVSRKAGAKAVLIDHSSSYLSERKSLSGAVMRIYEKGMTRTLRRFDITFCSVSKKSADWLTRLGINPATILPNSIDCKSFLRGSLNEDWRAMLGIRSSSFLVVYAGRLVEEKGVFKLIDAVNSLNDDISLVIAGSGPAESAVSREAGGRIHYVGRLDSGHVSSLLAASDVFCLPSEYPEGLPTALLEAASHSLGIIVSDTGGAEEIVPTEEYGIVLEDTRPETINAAIKRFYDDKGYLLSAGNLVHKRVSEEYSWDSTAKKLMDLLA